MWKSLDSSVACRCAKLPDNHAGVMDAAYKLVGMDCIDHIYLDGDLTNIDFDPPDPHQMDYISRSELLRMGLGMRCVQPGDKDRMSGRREDGAGTIPRMFQSPQ